MTGLGWLFMATSVGGVASLALWCFYRVLRAPPGSDEPHDDPPP